MSPTSKSSKYRPNGRSYVVMSPDATRADQAAAMSGTATAAVVGGGPAGLAAAEVLARGGVRTTVFEAKPTVGRKLLLAGRSGLNLTHGEPTPALLARYGAAAPRLAAAVERFDAEALRSWAADLGQATFVGTSGRVFPEGLRA